MTQSNKTEPNLSRVTYGQSGVQAPPKFLLIGVVGLFVLIIVGAIGGVWVFRDGLRPSQQQRIIEGLPFMRALLPPTPAGGAVPTVDASTVSDDDAMALLTIGLGEPGNSNLTAGAETVEETSEVVVATEATNTPPASPTPIPASPTAAPTSTPEPAIAPTQALQQAPASSGQSVAAAPVQATVVPAQSNLPNTARMFGVRHSQQTWNNCGPATITMALSFYGWQQDQAFAARFLKPYREDKNVSPSELVDFVNEQSDLSAMWRMGGNITVLKALIANNIPVVVERGIMFEANDWLGHYQLLVAYDDAQGVFYAYDSFLGPGSANEGIVQSYNDLDSDWRHFNRKFIVLYTPENEGLVRSILGELADEQRAAEIAFETAQAEALADRQDSHAWFNMGTSLTTLGRYNEAANAFDAARRPGMKPLPWRIMWYQFSPFQAYFEQGRYDDVLSLVQSNLNTAEEIEELYYWRGRVYQATGRTSQAQAEFRRALSFNSNFSAARSALEAS